MKLMAGLLVIQEGSLVIDGQAVSRLGASRDPIVKDRSFRIQPLRSEANPFEAAYRSTRGA